MVVHAYGFMTSTCRSIIKRRLVRGSERSTSAALSVCGARLLGCVSAGLLMVALIVGSAAPVAAHEVGPQDLDSGAFCIARGPMSDTSTETVLHKHNSQGTDAGLVTTSTELRLRSCVESQGEFFNSGLWTFILTLCAAAAAVMFVVAIGKGAGQMMRGQGAGLGQAIKSVLPLILMASLFAAIATLPIILLPLVQSIVTLILNAFNALLPT